MIFAYVYKLDPSETQGEVMSSWLSMLKSQYNFRLAERIEAYQQTKIEGLYCDIRSKSEITPFTCSLSKSALHGEVFKIKKDGTASKRSAYEIQSSNLVSLKTTRPWYREIYSAVLQQMLKQLDTAYKNFFEQGRGYPRFKRKADCKSFTYPQNVKFQGNKVYLPSIGWMKFYKSRAFPDGFTVKSVTVRLRPSGWYMSVRLEDKSVPVIIPQVSQDATVLGIDLGVKKLAALSNKEVIPNPKFRFNNKTNRQHEIRHRRVTRKQKGSKNRKKAVARLSILDELIARRRKDYQWKNASKIVALAQVVVFEDLNIQGMIRRCKPKLDENGKYIRNGQAAKTGLNRLILDAGWGDLKDKVKSLSTRAGVTVIEINPKHTSQECSQCGHIDKANRSCEKFVCTCCGHFVDADIDAAVVIAARGRKLLNLDAVRVDNSEQGKITLLETSPTLVGEPENQNFKVGRAEYVQLNLFAMDVNAG